MKQMAARSLHDEANKLDEDNTLVTIAKKISQQMYEMAQFTRRRGPIQVWTNAGGMTWTEYLLLQPGDWRAETSILHVLL